MIEQLKRQLFDEGHHITIAPDGDSWKWRAEWWSISGGGHHKGAADTYWQARRDARAKVAHVKRWQWRAAA